MSRAVAPPLNAPSSTGATLRASRTITKAIPTSSATAATSASRTTLLEFELEVVPVSVVAVVAVVVGVVSCPPCVSSLNALPPPTAVADIAGVASADESANAPRTQRHARTRWRDAMRWLLDTHASIAPACIGVCELDRAPGACARPIRKP